jgi:predicted O-methyltransferase YrrM
MTKNARRLPSAEWHSTGFQVLPSAYQNGLRISVSENQVCKVEKYLESEWGITILADASWANVDGSLVPESIWEKFVKIYNTRVDRIASGLKVSDELEREFYENIADEKLLSIVHSSKRSVIIDQICASYSVAQCLPNGSRILEVGSHAAHLGIYLASQTECSIISEDFSSRAIDLATFKGADLGRFRARVRNYCTWDGVAESFDLVIACCAGDKHSTPKLIEYCTKQVRQGGLLFFVGDDNLTASGRERVHHSLSSEGFTLVEADVAGGLELSGPEAGYGSRMLLVFLKDGVGSIPIDFGDIAGRHWRGFSEYANDPSTPESRKTQAWYNATVRSGRISSRIS